MKGRHQKAVPAVQAAAYHRELQAYYAWCAKHDWPSNLDAAAAAYEGATGFLFMDANPPGVGRHRA